MRVPGTDPAEGAARLRGRRRTVVGIAVVAVVSLAAGVGLAQFVMSPGEAAARTAPPEPSAITAPVERRELVSAIVTRGDAIYDGALEMTVETSALDVPPIVTGAVPAEGESLSAGEVLLELAGRPVVVLEGELPTYRSLAPGASGPDVRQLKSALTDLGIDAGDLEDDTYDAATAQGVVALYEHVGHPPPAVSEDVAQRLRSAEAAVESAEEGVRAARESLAAVRQGPGEAERLQLDAMVAAAERSLAQAKQGDEDGNVDEHAVIDAEEQLAIVIAQRREQLAPADDQAERAAVSAAQDRHEDATAERTAARAAAGTPLPAAEVVFLPAFPRRVDRVEVERGQHLDGPVARLSGAELVIVATLAGSDLEVVSSGAPAEIDIGGEVVTASVEQVRARTEGEGAGSGYEAVIVLDGAGDEDTEALRGQNLRVTIPIDATDGEVLVVPLAALMAEPDGTSRVEVERGDVEVVVQVEVGLAADGYAEVRPVEGELEEGDRVVVGR